MITEIVLSETTILIWLMCSTITFILSLLTELHYSGDTLNPLSVVMFLGLSFAFPAGIIMVISYWVSGRFNDS